MLEHYEIEHGLEPVTKLIQGLEAEILKIEAEAALAVAENPQTYAEINSLARTEINAVTEQYNAKIKDATAKAVAALAEADLSAQMTVYQQAFAQGILRVVPVIGEGIQEAIALETARNLAFIDLTLSRVEQYAGRNLTNIVQKSAFNLFNGETVEKVVKAAALEIRERGIQITLPSGRKVNDFEAYMRRHMVTSVAANNDVMQKDLADTLDFEDESKKKYATSSHYGARPEHFVWQGLIFNDWDTFVIETGYGEVTGICGVNCRHTWYVHIEGVSEQVFFPISEADNERIYKAQQQQRYLESQIRKWKRQRNVNETLSLDVTAEKAKIRQYQKALREHVNENNLTRQSAREQVAA